MAILKPLHLAAFDLMGKLSGSSRFSVVCVDFVAYKPEATIEQRLVSCLTETGQYDVNGKIAVWIAYSDFGC